MENEQIERWNKVKDDCKNGFTNGGSIFCKDLDNTDLDCQCLAIACPRINDNATEGMFRKLKIGVLRAKLSK
jgi:hypothetical protein